MNEFMELSGLAGVVQLAASDFSAALNDKGEIFVWGPTPRGPIPHPMNLALTQKSLESISFTSISLGD